jgi:hypothetical protein
MTIAVALSGFEHTAPISERARRINSGVLAPSLPLIEAQIAGGCSLIDRRPLAISAERGLVVRVRTGSLRVTPHDAAQDCVVVAGERFIADRAGLLVICALEATELHVEWPLRGIERLSPGLEPVEGIA